jgi:hypothetical protein
VKEPAEKVVSTGAPHWRESRRGRIPKEPLALYERGPVTLCSQPKSSPFWILLLWVFHRRNHRITLSILPVPIGLSASTNANLASVPVVHSSCRSPQSLGYKPSLDDALQSRNWSGVGRSLRDSCRAPMSYGLAIKGRHRWKVDRKSKLLVQVGLTD